MDKPTERSLVNKNFEEKINDETLFLMKIIISVRLTIRYTLSK